MIKRNKRISIGLILVNLILLTLAILCTLLKKDIFYAWYWMLVTLMLLFEVLYVFIWSKVGRNLDKYKSHTINRSFNDVTAVSIVLSGLIYLVVLFCEFYHKSISTSLYAIWSMYLLMTVAVLFNYLAVYNANKETKELVEKTFNKKNDRNDRKN